MTDTAYEPAAPEDFGHVDVYWGDGKGKTTAALGLGLRAVGHGYRVHLLQFLKHEGDRGWGTGEYTSLDLLPGISYEATGVAGWHQPEYNDDAHAESVAAGVERARTLLAAADKAELTTPFAPDGPPTAGVHLLILDELLYAVERGLVEQSVVQDLCATRPDRLELVITGGHERPDWLIDQADLVTHVRNVRHPADDGAKARQGIEY